MYLSNLVFTLLLQVVPIVSERFTFNCFYHFHYYKNLYAVSKQLKLIVISQYCYCIYYFYTVGSEYTNYLFLRAVYHGFLSKKYSYWNRTNLLALYRLTPPVVLRVHYSYLEYCMHYNLNYDLNSSSIEECAGVEPASIL